MLKEWGGVVVEVVYSRELEGYDFGEGHPFRGDRFVNFINYFVELGLHKNPLFRLVEPELVDDEDLLCVHDPDYVKYVKRLAQKGGYLSLDTPLKPGMDEYAKLIVSVSVTAGRAVAEGKCECAVGIGGGMHHAGIDYGGGFCIFNDVAVCAKMLLEDYGFKRILILDTDAHAGDGTMDIFYEDPSVLFISVHQDPRTLYPGKGFIWEVGAEEGKGFTICVPLPPRSGDDVYKLVLEEIFMPVAREFKPDVIIRNGGSDPHWGDALTNLGLSLSGFKMIGEYVKRAADEVCSGRLVDLIGSGYNPVVLPKAWTAIILGIAGVNMELKEVFKPPSWLNSPEILEAAKKIIDEVKVVHSEYWDCFK